MSALHDLTAEGQRQLEVCNACRYCEGYCAVFPALSRDVPLNPERVVYLSNLCHDCRACLQACMYADPHPFHLNIPTTLARVRRASYAEHTLRRTAHLVVRHELATVLLATFAALSVLLAALTVTSRFSLLWRVEAGPGAFYRVIPFLGMLVPAMFASAVIFAIWWRAAASVWRGGDLRFNALSPRLIWRSLEKAAVLRYLRGGGPGCYYPLPERPSQARRYAHIVVVTGFALAFLSTTLAAIWQDILKQLPPYPLVSAPVVSGSLGGLLMVVGCAVLLALKPASPGRLSDPEIRESDVAFLVVLGMASLSGLVLLVLRNSPGLGWALAVHIALLTALYFTAPYGKFAHASQRIAALMLNEAELAASSAKKAGA